MPVTASDDVQTLRELAHRYAEAAADPVQDERRDLWRRHNALQPTRPLIYLRGGRCWSEVDEVSRLRCTEPLLAGVERQMRQALFRHTCGDDGIIEPWITIRASYKVAGWGMDIERHRPAEAKGSWKHDPPIRDEADIDKLLSPTHEIDESATAQRAERLAEAIGDIVPIHVDRAPFYRVWSGDLASDLGHLRGIEQFMYDMMDRPKWLHRLLAHFRDGILRAHAQAEEAGDWSLAEHENQAEPYAADLEDPDPNVTGVSRDRLWVYMAAQEYELISPSMHDEFLLQYQLPILSAFGLSAYGCCENLTDKIDMLRQVPNLRRIAAAPRADLARFAEQVGTDYVISWRPNPAETVSIGFDADRIVRDTRRACEICRGLHWDITLKDVDTVQDDPRRLGQWVDIVRRIIEEQTT